MSNLMQPIVNINGTSRKELVQQRIDTMRAIEEVMVKLQTSKPHMRDYLGNNERYNSDLAIYSARFATLDKMRNEVQDEALAIHEGGK